MFPTGLVLGVYNKENKVIARLCRIVEDAKRL